MLKPNESVILRVNDKGIVRCLYAQQEHDGDKTPDWYACTRLLKDVDDEEEFMDCVLDMIDEARAARAPDKPAKPRPVVWRKSGSAKSKLGRGPAVKK